VNTNFAPSMAEMLKHEGGFVCNSHDPGGATNDGVTQAVYDDWRASRHLPEQTVKLIGKGEVEGIYRDLYWRPIHGDELPAGVDYAVFDFAFNSSVNRAARFLQRMVGVAEDGQIGPASLAAVRAMSPVQLIDRLCDARLIFLRSLSSWKYFGKGWATRVSDVRAVSKAMAS
jgi:lysozyme family protein